MFLQLLASEAQKLPEIDSDLKRAEATIAQATEIRTLEDLFMVSALRTRTFPFENFRHAINLNHLEAAVVKAKHFTAGSELEDDFV